MQLEWFAGTAWNAALQASEEEQLEVAAVLFSTAAAFLALHPDPDLGCLRTQKVTGLHSTV